jgi:CheY-like chemotaxis protein
MKSELFKDYKILIVEDDYNNRLLVERLLDKSDKYSASDGEEAMVLLKNHRFDLILLDLYMPNMNGISLLKYIREDLKRDTPIVVISASMPELHMEIVNEIEDFIYKPFSENELYNVIKKALKI